MKFEHIMVDLETLDNVSTAVILSIGAVRFDLDKLELGETFYTKIDPKSCQKLGLTIGASTVQWWLEQSKEAQEVFDNFDAPSLHDALREFSFFVRKVKDSLIWGNGATFDNMILRNAYDATTMPLPWSFRQDLCCRTIFKLFPISDRPKVGVRHNAADDAVSQAQSMIEIMRRLRATSVE